MDQVFARSKNFSLKNSPVLEIVKSADGIDESIDHDFVIAASERGVDSVARVKFAQWFQNGIVVSKKFNKGTG
jgi:hypothetical protein